MNRRPFIVKKARVRPAIYAKAIDRTTYKVTAWTADLSEAVRLSYNVARSVATRTLHTVTTNTTPRP